MDGNYPLVWNPAHTAWEGSGNLCATAINFRFACSPMAGYFGLQLQGPHSSDLVTAFATTCAPFLWSGTEAAGGSPLGLCVDGYAVQVVS